MNGIAESYVSGVSDAPLIGQTIGAALEHAATEWADRTALISRAQGVRWSWRELRIAPTPSPPASWRWGSAAAIA